MTIILLTHMIERDRCTTVLKRFLPVYLGQIGSKIVIVIFDNLLYMFDELYDGLGIIWSSE